LLDQAFRVLHGMSAQEVIHSAVLPVCLGQVDCGDMGAFTLQVRGHAVQGLTDFALRHHIVVEHDVYLATVQRDVVKVCAVPTLDNDFRGDA
jgi:hypothetical protein